MLVPCPMRFGAHVRAGIGLLPALQRGADIGAEVVQVFTQSPRMWKPSQYSAETLGAYRRAQAEQETVSSTFCHATYLINLGLARSRVGDQVEGVPSSQSPGRRGNGIRRPGSPSR